MIPGKTSSNWIDKGMTNALQISRIPELDAAGLRRFGLTTGAIVAGLFGVLFPFFFDRTWPIWPWVLFSVLAGWAIVAPSTLRPVYGCWMRIGLLLSRVTTPIILTLTFIVAILPASIVMRLLRKDFMQRSFNKSSTYRVKSTKPAVANMEKPY